MGNQQSCKCIGLNQNSKLQESTIIQVYNNTFFIKGNLNLNKQSTYKKLQVAATQFCASSGIGIQYSSLVMRLIWFNHDNILKAFSSLSQQQARIQFIDKMGQIYLDLMDSLYQYLVLKEDRKRALRLISNNAPCLCKALDIDQIKVQDRFDLISKGFNLLRSMKVAVVFMCAGASSRFFFQDKFLYPFDIANQETTLLKVLFEKLRSNLRAKSNQELIDVPIVVIGNQTNADQIEKYLKEHQFFYFNTTNIFFSDIPSLPILDKHGHICLNFEYNYLRRPKGSLCCLEQVLFPNAYQMLRKRKVQYLHFIGTQNLGQSPGDPLFLGLTHMLKRKASIKCTQPLHPLQNFDRIVQFGDQIRVLDIDSISQLQRKQALGSSIAMNSMVFSLDCSRDIVEKFNRQLQPQGLYKTIQITQNCYDFALKKPLVNHKCWTFQKDIKDVIACVQKPLILRVSRKEFIPIITPKNQYSIAQACVNHTKYCPLKKAQSEHNLNQYLHSQKNKQLRNMQYGKIKEI